MSTPKIDSETFSVIANCLESGLADKLGTAAIHAGNNGLRLTLNGRTIVRGRDPLEFRVNFRNAAYAAKTAGQ